MYTTERKNFIAKKFPISSTNTPSKWNKAILWPLSTSPSFNVYQFHFKDFEETFKKSPYSRKTLLNNKLFMQSYISSILRPQRTKQPEVMMVLKNLKVFFFFASSWSINLVVRKNRFLRDDAIKWKISEIFPF